MSDTGDATESPEVEALEVVATFATQVDCEPCRAALRGSGFRVFLLDANLVAIDPALWPALGGVKVAVLASEAEDARALIRAAEAGDLASSPELALHCPSCSSPDVRFEPRLDRASTIGLTVLGGVVAPIHGGGYVCNSCGTTVS